MICMCKGCRNKKVVNVKCPVCGEIHTVEEVNKATWDKYRTDVTEIQEAYKDGEMFQYQYVCPYWQMNYEGNEEYLIFER